MSAKRGLATAAGIIIVFNIFGKIFGLIRERTVGIAFGTSSFTDAFLVANTIPAIAFYAIGGALSTALIPVYKEYLASKGQNEADRLVSIVMNYSFIFLGIASILGVVFAPILIPILAPGFQKEVLNLTISLSQVLFPSILFMGLGVLMSGILNGRGHFSVPAVLPTLQSLIVILFITLLNVKIGIFSLAQAIIVGAIVQVLIQIPFLKRSNLKYTFSLDYHEEGVRRVFSLVLPVVVATSVTQIYLATNRFLGTGLTEGSIAALNFAFLLIQLPMGIFVSAIATVIFPLMSEQAAIKDRGGMAYTLFTSLRSMAFLVIPSSVALAYFRGPLVQLIYEGGAFDARATELTSFALLFFSIGLLGFSIPFIVNRAYYAFQDTRTPLKIGLASVLLNLVLSFFFLPVFGHGGLALANSIAITCNSFSLIYLLKKKLPSISMKKIIASFLWLSLAAFVMLVVIIGFENQLEKYLRPSNGFKLLIYFILNGTVGISTYLLAVYILRLEEGKIFWNSVLKTIKK